jgi:hypothetical protein
MNLQLIEAWVTYYSSSTPIKHNDTELIDVVMFDGEGLRVSRG